MRLAELTLHEPTRLQDVFGLLRRVGPRARLLAGGTDVLVDLKTRRISAEHLVSLRGIPGLAGIELLAGAGGGAPGLRIGALTLIADVESSPLLTGPHAVLREAAAEMASPQVRNAATLGGNLAGGVPCADMPPVLGVLGAALVLSSESGERRLAVAEFFIGPRATALREGEVLTAVEVPPAPPGVGAAYARLALREGNAIAVASVAASVRADPTGRVREARLFLGAVAPVPRRVSAVESALLGMGAAQAADLAASAAMAAAEPISDIRGSADYRREVVGVLARRALLGAHARAMEAQP